MAFWTMVGFRWWVGMAMLGHAFAGRKRRAGLKGRQRGYWPDEMGVKVELRDERIAWQRDLVARRKGSNFGELCHLKALVRFYR